MMRSQMPVHASGDSAKWVDVFPPHRGYHSHESFQRIGEGKADAAAQVQEIPPLDPVVIEQEDRYAEPGFRKLEAVVRDHQALEKADGKSRGHEISDLGVQAAPIRTNTSDLLNHCMSNLSLEVESRRDRIEEAAYVHAHSQRTKVRSDGGVTEAFVMMTGDDPFSERGDGQRPLLQAIPEPEAEVLNTAMKRAVVDRFRLSTDVDRMRVIANVPRCDEGKCQAQRNLVG